MSRIETIEVTDELHARIAEAQAQADAKAWRDRVRALLVREAEREGQ